MWWKTNSLSSLFCHFHHFFVGWMVVCVCVPSRVSHRCHFDWIPEPCVKLPWLTTTRISLTNVLSGIVGHSSDGRTLPLSPFLSHCHSLSAHDEFPQNVFFCIALFLFVVYFDVSVIYLWVLFFAFFSNGNKNNNEKMFLHIISFIFHLFYVFLFL